MMGHFVKCLILFNAITWINCGKARNPDLIVTKKEKHELDKLMGRVLKDLPNDYMKTHIYLLNWIRAAAGNVDKAEKMLRDNLKWRKEYKMDNILNEDFSEMETDFPIDLDGVDNAGRPLLVVDVGEWDVRKSHITGKHDENYRYSFRALELASQKVRDAQAEGKPITRFSVIFDMNGFTLGRHGCIQCVPPYLTFLLSFQKHYPEMVEKVILVNVPTDVEAVFGILRPIISTRLRRILRIFGKSNRAEYQQYLLSIIPPDQLDVSLGGTKRIEI